MHCQSEHASQATHDGDHRDNLEPLQQHTISRGIRPGTGVPLTVLVVDGCERGSFLYRLARPPECLSQFPHHAARAMRQFW
jgi:hypothetical protein